MRLILASTSPSRRRILAMAGIEPFAVAPGVDETAAVAAAGATGGEAVVQLLAEAKATAVAARTDGERDADDKEPECAPQPVVRGALEDRESDREPESHQRKDAPRDQLGGCVARFPGRASAARAPCART